VPVIARVRGFIDHLLRYRPQHYLVLKRFVGDAVGIVWGLPLALHRLVHPGLLTRHPRALKTPLKTVVADKRGLDPWRMRSPERCRVGVKLVSIVRVNRNRLSRVFP
jgi:class 3 adenylate cyclase